ncbi:MAG: hypothetical protein ABSG38_14720 [Spirochaetia bacterium]
MTPGFNWITAFTAGVEMLGLHNWGMPCRDPVTGKILSLHGEAAVIPVDRVAVRSAPIMTIPGVEMTASFIVRAPLFDRSRSASPWHQQGEPVYRVTRAVTLRPSRQEVSIRDRVTNLTARTAIPDWGYHVQLRPEPGARYLVPSQEVRARFGGTVPAGHEAWHPAAVSRRREERGYAHRRLATRRGRICTLLRYPDGSGTEVILPRFAFLMSWFSAGGTGSEEFMIPREGGSPPVPVIQRNWDGVGPELGTSDLDHAGQVEPGIRVLPLPPGGSREVEIKVRRHPYDRCGMKCRTRGRRSLVDVRPSHDMDSQSFAVSFDSFDMCRPWRYTAARRRERTDDI